MRCELTLKTVKPRLNRDTQSGQGMTEYIIIVALIAIAAIGAYSYFGKAVRSDVAGMTEQLAGEAVTTHKDATDAATKAAAEAGKDKGLKNYDSGNLPAAK